MEPPATVTVIGCGVLRPDLTAIAQRHGLALAFRFLPGGLHDRPDELRRRLQSAIDEVDSDPDCRRIVIGYGLCGMGTVNIQARRVPLVIPRVHDCIALFLGSDQAYREQFASEPGTYYISAGWFREQLAGRKSGDQIWVGEKSMGCRQIAERYGEKAAGRIIDFFSSWQANYRRAAFIDTGLPESTTQARHAEEMARRHGWQFSRIQGDQDLLTRLLTAETSNETLLVVPPGYTTIHDGISNCLAAAPVNDPASARQPSLRNFTIGAGQEEKCHLQYGLGIDAGGTFTDAVIHDFTSGTIIAKHKALTTKWHFSLGIDAALAGLPADLLTRVEMVAVSTTLATNAIVEGEGQPTGLIVMAGDNPVKELFPHRPCAFVAGRLNMDGVEIEPIDPAEIRDIARHMVDNDGVSGFAVSGFAGAINPQHELLVKQLLREETGCVVCCGHELSDQLNLTVRAQTAVLNARIIPRMLQFFEQLAEVLAYRAITAPVMVVKGDGTLMSAAMAREKPVETILSGPAASVAGARYLTGIGQAIVVDMGGTTTDTAAIKEGLVKVCENGARVGGHQTHVRALEMRTIGLGGDSLIIHDGGQPRIGPGRVMPLVVAGSIASGDLDQALQYLSSRVAGRPRAPFAQQIVMATGCSRGFELKEKDAAILNLLSQRPYALDELSAVLGYLSHQFLPLAQLEQYGLVQRCGLTPTDLLHVSGRFHRWPVQPVNHWLTMLSRATGQAPEKLTETLLQEVERELARELLTKQLAEETDVDRLEDCRLCRHLTDKLLTSQKGDFALQVKMQRPIIGIGAPISHFLPQTARLLGAEAIIPEHAEVANAVGAITSRIRLRRQLHIRPDDRGRFLVEGITGGRFFSELVQAEEWAVGQLLEDMHRLGRLSGTSAAAVDFTISDSTSSLAGGQTLFLGRTIRACLSGLPDLLVSDSPVLEAELLF